VQNTDETPRFLLDRLVERMRMPDLGRNRLSAICTYRTQRRVSFGAVCTTPDRHVGSCLLVSSFHHTRNADVRNDERHPPRSWLLLRMSSQMTTVHISTGTVSPEQFDDLWNGTAESSGEVRLAMAVLVQAIEDLRKFRGGVEGSDARHLYRQARRWIASNERHWLYSFVNVSEILNIPSERTRTRLLDHAAPCPRVARG
jgi:hypothetical protein